MAYKNVATGAALIQRPVEEKMWREVGYLSYFNQFTSSKKEDKNAIVQKIRDLPKGAGETVRFGLVKKLVEDGVGEGTPAIGNEEMISDTYLDVTLSYIRKSVGVNMHMARQRSSYDLEAESKEALKVWGAEYLDGLHFTALFNSPTKILYRASADGAFTGTSSAATAKAAMSATNGVITPNFISDIRAWASTGGNRSINPLVPIKVEGGNYYVLLVHTNVANDLRKNSDYQSALREAEVRGSQNPLFKNSVAIWNGVVVHEHERVPQGDDGGGASVHYSKGVLMGAQALLRADGMLVPFEEELTDYGAKKGYCWGLITKVQKPVFDSKDYNSVGIYLACSNTTGK